VPEPEFTHMTAPERLGDRKVPDVVRRLAAPVDPALVWRNELGGLTFRADDRITYYRQLWDLTS